MAKKRKIIISTKVQNIFLGAVVAFFCVIVASKAYVALSENKNKITERVVTSLEQDLGHVEESINNYYSTNFKSFGELFYEKDIKRAVLTRNTRLFPVHQRKARVALRDFALFKGLQDVFLFDTEYKLMISFKRTIELTNSNIFDIQKRLENYKKQQVIYQNINGRDVVIFILRLDYSKLNSAYLVVMEDLEEFTKSLADYESKSAEYYAISRTLGYKNSLIKLKGVDSYSYFNLQEDTLLKYNKYFTKSFNSKGNQTIAKTLDINGYQHSFVLGMLKPDELKKEIQKNRNTIIDYYQDWAVWAFIWFLFFVILVVFKINIHKEIIRSVSFMIKVLSKKESSRAKELSKDAKKQAYSYIEKEHDLKNSVFSVYNSLKKMSPEDIRNLSIKNSLSKENIRLVYQPVVDSKTLQPQFCEVFLRLLNYYGEELMPSEFIPVLKHFNMLENLDEMMLEKMIKKIQTLNTTDPTARISLNISNGAFNSYKFLDKLKYALKDGGINTYNVLLEIPEIDIINEPKHIDFINELTQAGVQFAISVYDLDISTAKKIVEHGIHYVRVDMSKFADVLETESKQELLKQVLANAKKYDLTIIAERIETEFMFKLARSLDIQLLQGYHIGKPKKYYTHK